ncbi:DUF885 domain-containing protein [Tellurirhabdus bombi]|uniref:DUF885 domain-containing protein n=1 Tax=Tellurirhabdus bombi TaxID=2907205 RepID=UPI001F389C2C|nr:DUF885 domain-containing protein [Tellurirhabdus bombi]
MKHYLPLLLLFLAACQPSDKVDTDFTALSDEYLTVYMDNNPQTAVYLGLHEYDSKLVVPTQANIARRLSQLQHYDSAFAKLDTSQLSPDLKIDYKLLTAAIKNDIYSIVDRKVYENPLNYSVAFNSYIERNFAPAEERLKSAVALAKQVPAYYEAAKKNIGPSPAREWVDLAIESARGSSQYIKSDVISAFSGIKNPALQQELNQTMQAAAQASDAFADYLTQNVLPTAKGSFAIGLSNYKKMLRYNELLEIDPDSILAMGMHQIEKEKAEFAAAAKVIDPSKTPAAVFQTLQDEHPTADSLIDDTRQQCEKIRQFLLDKQIISIPSEVRATVTKTPESMVGATAAMNTPGPFEKPTASEAYYYITLPRKTWSAKESEEWLRQFNRYVTEIVTIHEAYPGHYVQFLHLNASKASKIRKIFSSYAFVEGWAHYTEQMMLEEGFGATDPVTAAKYKMAQLSESLLRYCRLVSSIQEHTHGWSVQQSTKFFMDNCYYAEKPAYEEARRGTFDPGYLSYSLGKLQILALRDEIKKKQGDRFKLKTFHDALLAQGMPPVSMIREVLLRE